MKYRLIVSFPLNVSTIERETKEVIRRAGREPVASGAGFGWRDVEFEYPSTFDRKRATDQFKARKYRVVTQNVE